MVHSLLEQSWVSLGEGLMQIKLLFLSVSTPLLLALCSLGVLKLLNWSLEFSERYFGSYIIIKSVFLWGKTRVGTSYSVILPISLLCKS